MLDLSAKVDQKLIINNNGRSAKLLYWRLLEQILRAPVEELKIVLAFQNQRLIKLQKKTQV